MIDFWSVRSTLSCRHILYNQHIMKKFIQYIAIFGLLVVLPLSFVRGQNVIATKNTDKVEAKEADPIDQLGIKNQTLSIRKQKV